MNKSRERREKVSLTAARVLALPCNGNGQTIHWDAKTPGFGLRVTEGGARAYVFESRLFGKSLRVTIGDAAAWELGKARTEAARLRTLVDSGVDPRQVRIEQREALERMRRDADAARAKATEFDLEARRRETTFGEAWDVYVNARKPFWSERHFRDHCQHAQIGGEQRKRDSKLTKPGPLAHLRQVRLTDLTSNRISEWLATESADRSTMTALSFRLLRGFIRWSRDVPAYAGLVPENAYKAREVTDSIPRVRAKEGDALQREQLASWFKSVRSLDNLVASVYLQGLLITGARREELAVLEWKDVDFVWRSLTLHDKVEGTGGRTIPLTPYLAEQLQRLQAFRRSGLTEADRDWVFVSKTSSEGNISEPRSAHTRALASAGLPHVSLHGLRRSFGTLAEWCEVPVGIVAQIQGHKPSAIAEKHYRRRPIDLLRMWHDKIEAWMLVQAGLPMPKTTADTASRH
jgi:integrase